MNEKHGSESKKLQPETQFYVKKKEVN